MSNELLELLNANAYTPDSSIPSYEVYNKQPSLYLDEGYRDLLADDALRSAQHDARGSAYNSLYFGGDVQRDLIVGQQIMRAAYAVTHMQDADSFSTYLEDKMGMVPEQATLLSSHYAAIKEIFPAGTEFSATTLNDDQKELLGEMVKRTHNWGQQKEHFLGAESHVESCLSNGAFTDFLNDKLTDAETLSKGMPPTNAIAGQMGLLNDIGSEAKEALQIWQAANRFEGIGMDHFKGLVPLKDFEATPAAFPEKFADDIDEFAKYSQTLVKAFAGIEQAHELGGLSEEDYAKAQLIGKQVSYHGLDNIQSTMAEVIATRTEKLEGLQGQEGSEAEVTKLGNLIERDNLLLDQFKLQQNTLKEHLLEKDPSLATESGALALPPQGELAAALLATFGKSLSQLQAQGEMTGKEVGDAMGYVLDKIVPYSTEPDVAREAFLNGLGAPGAELIEMPEIEKPFEGPSHAVGM